MLEFVRRKALKDHQNAQKDVADKAAIESKHKNIKVKPEVVPFKINVQTIGISLQFTSFDFVFSSLYRRIS